MTVFSGDTQTQETAWAKWTEEQIWILAGALRYCVWPFLLQLVLGMLETHPQWPGPACASRIGTDTSVSLETERGTLAGMQQGFHWPWFLLSLQRWIRSREDRKHKTDSAVPCGHQRSALLDRAAGPGGKSHLGRWGLRWWRHYFYLQKKSASGTIKYGQMQVTLLYFEFQKLTKLKKNIKSNDVNIC